MEILNLTFPQSDQFILERIFRKEMWVPRIYFATSAYKISGNKYSKFLNSDFKKRGLECNSTSLVLKFVY
jgi:ribosomal protein L20